MFFEIRQAAEETSKAQTLCYKKGQDRIADSVFRVRKSSFSHQIIYKKLPCKSKKTLSKMTNK